jgi:hypothetical protein
MPQVEGVVYHGDGSTASGRKVSGMAGGSFGGMVGSTHTDSRGHFVLSWNSSTTTLAKLYVDGSVKRENVRAGDYIEIRL